jgi:hypothetical protein
MTGDQQHPEELLAEFVDGTLGPEDRARVESHVATCVSCREEITLAGSARQALGTLAELGVPAGTTWPVVQRAGQRRRWLPALSPRVAWAAGGAAAVAAAVIGGFVLTGGLQRPAGDSAAAPAGRGAPEVSEAQDETAGRLSEGDRTYPTFRRSDREFDGASLPSLTQDLTAEANTALEHGFLEPPARYYTQTAVANLSGQTRRALSCVAGAISPDRSLAPFTIVAARFEGDPAYIAAFLQADAPDQPYKELALYVVSRDGCALRSFARQRL